MSAELPLPVVTLGESLLLLSSEEPNGLLHDQTLRVDIGGAESNFAIGLARLGVPTTWIGRVGNDNAGMRIIRELRAEGVNTLEVVDEASTGLMVKERLAGGVVRVQYYRTDSAGSRLTPADIPAATIINASILHVTGISLAISETARQAVHSAVATAVEAGVRVSFDVNHRSSLVPAELAEHLYRPIAELADVIFAGEDEARLLLGQSPDNGASAEHLALGLARLGRGHAIVKRGSQGSVLAEHGETWTGGVHPVDVVDPVGAGDAFVAGYVSEFIADAPPERRLHTAAFAGAMACSVTSDWKGAPFRRDLSYLRAQALSTSAERVLR